MGKLIFVPNNIPSSKNSKIATSRGVFMSKTTKKFLAALGIQRFSPSKKEVKGYAKKPNLFKELEPQFKEQLIDKEPPYVIGFHFVRGTKHKFDFHNMVQIIADLMVAHDFIPDDDMDYFIPKPFKVKGNWYSYNKENPGVYIKIY
jgi:hypothetical protein